MASQPEEIVLTYQDLQDLPEDRNRYEIYEGELEVTAAPTPRHQAVVGQLHLLLGGYVAANDLGTVFVAPLDAGVVDRKHGHQGVRPGQPTGVRRRVVVRDVENAYQGLRDADEARVVRFQSAWVLFRSEK